MFCSPVAFHTHVNSPLLSRALQGPAGAGSAYVVAGCCFRLTKALGVLKDARGANVGDFIFLQKPLTTSDKPLGSLRLLSLGFHLSAMGQTRTREVLCPNCQDVIVSNSCVELFT